MRLNFIFIIALFFLFFISCKDSVVQTSDSTNEKLIFFEKYYDLAYYDAGHSVIETLNGNFVIVGATNSMFEDPPRIFIICIDHEGNKLWEKFGAPSSIGYSVIQTKDNGFIIAGISNGDMCLIKTNETGDIVWEKTYGGNSIDCATNIQATSDGGYVIVGNTRPFGNGNYDVYLIKVDLTGNKMWQKTFGGSSDDYGRSVIETSDKGFFIT
ncbi:MAG: hypothetical protein PVH88_17680 [Ignavibacteria bacterium]